jgi:hypothetical protein
MPSPVTAALLSASGYAVAASFCAHAPYCAADSVVFTAATAADAPMSSVRRDISSAYAVMKHGFDAAAEAR